MPDLPYWLQIVPADFLKLGVTLLLTLPIAYNREKDTRIMGLRTFPIVGVATCSFVLVGQSFLGQVSADAQARIVQGILAGIGFIGGGAILKNGNTVLGTATAASIWATGALGIAVAYNRYDIAIFMCVFTFLILRWVTPLKEIINSNNHESQKSSDS